ncbi:MAG: hypothetical protein AAGJ81_10585 [Verrucomicrobiota bacterium]
MRALREVVEELLRVPENMPREVVVRCEVGGLARGTVLEWDEELRAYCAGRTCVFGWRVAQGWQEEFGPLWEWRESALVAGQEGFAYMGPLRRTAVL